jgi:hypothetical protein
MAGVVRTAPRRSSVFAAFAILVIAGSSSAQSEPNPDWADPPPAEYEERSAQNPDWVEESEPPPVGDMRRRASEFYDIRYANRDLTMPRGMMRGTFDTVVGKQLGSD